MKKFKDSVKNSLKGYFGELYSEGEIGNTLEKPRNPEFGDIAFPCFNLNKAGKGENPAKMAQNIKEKIELDSDLIESVSTVGPFVNFKYRNGAVVNEVLREVLSKKKEYGNSDIGDRKFVIVEYSSPNTGKPMHVGHIRSTILGESISKILSKAGYRVHRMNYLGDVGLHLGKVIAAYNKWGNMDEMEKDPEKCMLKLYTKFCENERCAEKKSVGMDVPEMLNDDEYSNDNPWTMEAKSVLEKIEGGDSETCRILEKINNLSMEAFDRIYTTLGVKFDEITGQSKFGDRGKDIILDALYKDIIYKDKSGAIKSKLEKFGLPDKVLLRSDGTAIYSTQDIGAAKTRHENYNFDRMVYVVGEEQSIYFRQLFKTLEMMGEDWAKKCVHLPFGHLKLPGGKMSTREGNVVFLEEVLDQAVDIAKKEIGNRNPEIENKDYLAKMIGLGSLKYMILGVDARKPIQFTWEKALDFNSNSAPYMQYSYARGMSIMRKAGASDPVEFRSSEIISPYEIGLIKKIGEYPHILEIAAENLAPNKIAEYANMLAMDFNSGFYSNMKVVGSESQDSRLAIVNAYRQTLMNSLGMLGIEVPSFM